MDFRFYNLAGNPMMARLAEGTVDVVLELDGQLPHDVVPGAYIAMKAGAVFGNIDGDKTFSEQELADFLLKPADQSIRYILAANKDL